MLECRVLHYLACQTVNIYLNKVTCLLNKMLGYCCTLIPTRNFQRTRLVCDDYLSSGQSCQITNWHESIDTGWDLYLNIILIDSKSLQRNTSDLPASSIRLTDLCGFRSSCSLHCMLYAKGFVAHGQAFVSVPCLRYDDHVLIEKLIGIW